MSNKKLKKYRIARVIIGRMSIKDLILCHRKASQKFSNPASNLGKKNYSMV